MVHWVQLCLNLWYQDQVHLPDQVSALDLQELFWDYCLENPWYPLIPAAYVTRAPTHPATNPPPLVCMLGCPPPAPTPVPSPAPGGAGSPPAQTSSMVYNKSPDTALATWKSMPGCLKTSCGPQDNLPWSCHKMMPPRRCALCGTFAMYAAVNAIGGQTTGPIMQWSMLASWPGATRHFHHLHLCPPVPDGSGRGSLTVRILPIHQKISHVIHSITDQASSCILCQTKISQLCVPSVTPQGRGSREPQGI